MSFRNKSQSFSSFFEGITFVGVPFLGLGLIRLWLLNLSASGLTHSTVFDFNIIFWISLLATIAVTMAIVRKIGSLHDCGLYCLSGIAALLVGTILLMVSARFGPWPIVGILGCVLASIGYTAFLLLWFELYACISTARMVFAYACSNILAAGIWQLLSSVSIPSAYVLLLVLPILSAASLSISFNKPEAKREALLADSEAAALPRPSSLSRVSVWIACFSLATGFFLSYNTTIQVSLAYVLTGVIIIVGYIFFNKRFDFSILYRMSLPFIVLGLIIAPFIGSGSAWASLLISVGKEAALAVALAIACNISYRKGVSGAYACGFVYFANIASMLLGKLLQTHVSAVSESLNIPDSAVLIVICVLCIVAAALIFNERHFALHWQDTGLVKSGDDEETALRVHDVATTYKLSAREEEILALLASGKSYAEIGDELFISQGTVRVHVNHIVTKMDVPNREALLDLFK